jgi:hypothetical protein
MRSTDARMLLATASTVLFENDRIRISDFRLAPGESGGLAEHLHPTIRWQVGNGMHQRGNEAPSSVADKHIFWVDAGSAFVCTNCGESEYRQICWELKQAPKRDEAEVRRLLDSALYSTDVGTELLFENAYCRVWDFFLEPGAGDLAVPHHHVLDYVFVYVAPGRLLGSFHDGSPGLFDSINDDNDVTWFDIPDGAAQDVSFAHGGKNGYDDRPMREYLVELK